jgi:hypothetical protein
MADGSFITHVHSSHLFTIGTFFLFGAPGAVYIVRRVAPGYYGYDYYSTNYGAVFGALVVPGFLFSL